MRIGVFQTDEMSYKCILHATGEILIKKSDWDSFLRDRIEETEGSRVAVGPTCPGLVHY